MTNVFQVQIKVDIYWRFVAIASIFLLTAQRFWQDSEFSKKKIFYLHFPHFTTVHVAFCEEQTQFLF